MAPKNQAKPTLAEVVEKVRRQCIEERLVQHDGNRKHTAVSLGISRQQLQNLIKKYEIMIPPPLRYRSSSNSV